MVSVLEYMQLSQRVYDASRDNKIGVPADWAELEWLPDDPDTGFSVGAYKKGNEIVIAYTGTNGHGDYLNWAGGIGLPVEQIFQAMKYYLRFIVSFRTTA